MKILIANEDVSSNLSAAIRADVAAAAQRKAPVFVPPGISALRLADATDEAAYRATLIRLLRVRHGISTEDFPVPRGPGRLGGLMQALKQHIWKFLRYQHQHITFQQNFINELMIHTLEFEVEARDRELAALRREVAALRNKERGA